MHSPIIGVASHTDVNKFNSPITSIPLAYTQAIETAGGIPLILPFTQDKKILTQMIAQVDGILLPGGYDLDPEFYGQDPEPKLGIVDRDLDVYQMAVVHMAMEKKMAMLGICRGAQVINVALGGTLYQDIPTRFPDSSLFHMQKTLHHGTDHGVNFTPESRLHSWFGPTIKINSRHHQSIKDPGTDLIVTAKAPDGIIEGAQHVSLPIDLIQWHPELMMQKNHDMLPLFTAFVDNCRK